MSATLGYFVQKSAALSCRIIPSSGVVFHGAQCSVVHASKAASWAGGIQPQGLLAVQMLIVEDDEQTLAALMVLARRMGYTPEGASTVAMAMEAIQRSSPQVLITDWDLGDHGNGIELAAMALALNSHCQVVFCSGSDQAQLRYQTRHLSICSYLKKPVPLCELRSALSAVLEQ